MHFFQFFATSFLILGLSGGYKDSKYKKNSGYYIKYKPAIAPEEFLKEHSYDPGLEEIKLDNLIPNLDYVIHIYEKIPLEDKNGTIING